MRIIVEVLEENIALLKKEYKERTGKEPSEYWIRKFLKADANHQYNFGFNDGLEDAVEYKLEEEWERGGVHNSRPEY